MANRYFVGAVDEDWNDTGNWSDESGGAGGETVPTSSDDVFFDAESPSCEVDIAASAKSIDCTGYTDTLTLAANLTVSGNITLVSGMTFTPSTYKVLVAGDGTLTSGGKSFYDLDLTTANLTLGDNITVTRHLTYGAANMNISGGKTISVGGDFKRTSGVAYRFGYTTDADCTVVMNGSGNQQLSDGNGILIRTNLTIANTGGTLTFGGNITLGEGNALTFTYTSSGGAVDAGTSTVTWNAVNGTLNVDGIDFYNLTFASGAVSSETLTSNLTVTNLLNHGTAQISFTAASAKYIYCQGSFKRGTAGAYIFGYTSSSNVTLVFNGGNNQTVGDANNYSISLPITINKSGNTLTFANTFSFGLYSTPTFTYTAGTVDAGTSTLSIAGSCTLNTDGIDWYNITHSATNTCTLSSALTSTNTHTFTGATTFSGAYNITAKDVTLNGNVTHTLSGNIDASGNLAISTSAVINGAFELQVAGNVTCATSTLLTGTATLVCDGTGNVTGSTGNTGFGINWEIDTAGTITLVNRILFYNSKTFTYTTGTVDAGTSTFAVIGSVTLDTDGIDFYDYEQVTNGTVTLLSDLSIDHAFNLVDSSTMNGAFNIKSSGSLTVSGTKILSGTATLLLDGTGTVTANAGANTGFGLNVTINTAGTVTLAGTITFYGGKTWLYTTGTVDAGTSTLSMNNAVTLNSNGMSWYAIDFGANLTLTLGSNLTFTNNWNAANKNVTLSGNYALIANGTSTMKAGTGLSMYNFTINAGKTVHLTSAQTFAVTGTFNAIGTSEAGITLDATTPDSQSNFNVTTVGTVSYVTATDINSSGGSQIYNANGTLDNATNWTTALNIIVTPSALNLTLAGQAPTFTYDYLLALSGLALTLTQKSPVAVYNITLTPSNLELTLTQQTPTVDINYDIVILPSALSLLLSQLSPSLNYDYTILPSKLDLTLTINTPNTNYDYAYVPTTLAMTISTQEPSLNFDYVLQIANTLALTLAQQTPTIKADWTEFASALALNLAQQTPNINYTCNVSPDTLTLTLAQGAVTIEIARQTYFVCSTENPDTVDLYVDGSKVADWTVA